uniref:Uncharacterized protein n=1 Tax=Lactuca sativa TaxID=4236 RepID=A0A9R1V726_LACSA|nr:hypothetical protein LSAT_V11C600318320 [Lactuca sativa]
MLLKAVKVHLVITFHFDLITNLKKCDYFEWKYKQQEEGYYKNLLYSLTQKLDDKEDRGVINNLRNMIFELEFFLSKEKSVVGSIENELFDSKKTIRRYKTMVSFLVLGLSECWVGAFGVSIRVWCMYWGVKLLL